MAKATSTKDRAEQKVWLRQAAEGNLGPYSKMPAQLQKDLKANKTLYNLAVKNGVAPAPRKTTTKK